MAQTLHILETKSIGIHLAGLVSQLLINQRYQRIIEIFNIIYTKKTILNVNPLSQSDHNYSFAIVNQLTLSVD